MAVFVTIFLIIAIAFTIHVIEALNDGDYHLVIPCIVVIGLCIFVIITVIR